MSGLVGIFTHDSSIDHDRLNRAAATLAHRGTEGRNLILNRTIGLAHAQSLQKNLATGSAASPANARQLSLTIDGDIYNQPELQATLERKGYVFKTQSKAELIQHAHHAYQDDFLSHIYGAFALALYDHELDQLLLARDRLGIKPLFLAQLPDGIAFASELKALLPILNNSPTINPQALIQFLHQQFSSGSATILKGVERLAPGEAITIKAGRVSKRWHYWSATNIKPLSLTLPEAQETFSPLMETVMRQHMRSSTPPGLFLSGGVDSGTLLGLLTQYGSGPIRTFSVGFPDSDVQDELPPARLLAEHYGSIHTEIQPNREELFQHLPLTVWAADDLMRDYAMLPTSLLAQRAADDLQVVFSGEGGDEIFAGYRRFASNGISRMWKSLLRPGSGGYRTSGSLSQRDVRQLLSPALQAAFLDVRAPYIHAWQEAPSYWSSMQRMQYIELRTALPDNLMVKVDRMMMPWGLEGRMPFLDHRVVEFGLALPDKLKVHDKIGKYFLKQWASPLLSNEQLTARKRGFYVPVGAWLSGEFLDRLGRVLPSLPSIAEWFQPEAVKYLVVQQQQRKGHAARLLFALLQFAIWHRLFIEGDGQRPPAFIDPLEFLMS